MKTSSAVDLSVTNSGNQHTGTIDAPAEITDDVVTAYEENIPGSKYVQSEDSGNGPSTVVYIPRNGGSYSVTVQGNSVGTFDMSVDIVKGDKVIDSVHYDAIPVLPTTLASTTITTLGSTLSSSTPLAVDISGNGTSTFSVIPGSVPDPVLYFEVLKKGLDNIDSSSRMKSIFNRIDGIEGRIRSGKKLPYHNDEYIAQNMRHRKLWKLSSDDRSKIIDMLDRFVSQFE